MHWMPAGIYADRNGSLLNNTKDANHITGEVALSPRPNEKEIWLVQLLCDGLNTGEIAKKMFLSRHTIDNMRKSLLRKFEVKNSVSIVRKAIRLGIVDG